MSYDVSNFSKYIARENQALTATLFAGGDTAKFALYMGGVKGTSSVPHIADTATLQAGNCKSPSGDTVITEVNITVEPFTVFEGFCEDDLQDKFPNTILAPGSNNHDAPSEMEDRLIETKASKINEVLEQTYWRGTKGEGSFPLFDGFIKLVDAAAAIDGNTDGVTAIAGITKDNVIGIVNAMRVAAPAKVKRSKDFVIAVGDDVFDMYIQAQKDANQYSYNAEHDNGVYAIGGSQGKLIRVYGLDGTDRMFASVGANFITGADVDAEKDVAKVWYDETDDKVYLRFKGKAGVQINNPSEIVQFTLVA